jgi:hypothetical protein
MYQMEIPGAEVNIYPQTMHECETLFNEICITFTKSVVPEEYIKEAYQTTQMRTKIKRLREKVISYGYILMLHLKEAMDDPKLFHGFMWREDLIVKWNHFDLSLDRLFEFMDEHGTKCEKA